MSQQIKLEDAAPASSSPHRRGQHRTRAHLAHAL